MFDEDGAGLTREYHHFPDVGQGPPLADEIVLGYYGRHPETVVVAELQAGCLRFVGHGSDLRFPSGERVQIAGRLVLFVVFFVAGSVGIPGDG